MNLVIQNDFVKNLTSLINKYALKIAIAVFFDGKDFFINTDQTNSLFYTQPEIYCDENLCFECCSLFDCKTFDFSFRYSTMTDKEEEKLQDRKRVTSETIKKILTSCAVAYHRYNYPYKEITVEFR